jgi:hypothetical protein
MSLQVIAFTLACIALAISLYPIKHGFSGRRSTRHSSAGGSAEPAQSSPQASSPSTLRSSAVVARTTATPAPDAPEGGRLGGIAGATTGPAGGLPGGFTGGFRDRP